MTKEERREEVLNRHKNTDWSKTKNSDAARNNWISAEYRQKQRKWRTEENRSKISEYMKQRYTDKDVQYRHLLGVSIARKYISHKRTDIELLLARELDYRLIDYSQQDMVGRYIVDFLLPGGVVIEADGDYWHATPKSIVKDNERDTIMSSNGYIVRRIKGSELKTNPSLSLSKICGLYLDYIGYD